MDDELLKHNTDCVYFLASPFTCKKGAECDYRHSEMARLNLRDCWYWLSGSCLNPSCGFRHPPVETQTKAPAAEVEPMSNISCLPPSKKNVPCYFYFNGYCNKGVKCPFVHDTEDVSASKQRDPAVVVAPSIDDRRPPDSSNHIIPAGLLNDKLQPNKILNTKLPARTLSTKLANGDAPEAFSDVLRRTQKVANGDASPRKRQRDMTSILGWKDSPQSLAYKYEEASITKSDSFNESDHVIKTEPSLSSDQFSEEIVENGAQGEWCESSPEFDIVVKERREYIEVADDQEDMLGYDGIDKDHEKLFMDYCYGDQKAYGGRFLREGIQRRMHEPCYCYSEDDGDGGTTDMLSQKRKVMNGGLTLGGRYGEDLRDHLTKRRSLDGRLEMRAERYPFKRCNVPQRMMRFLGRLEPKLERNGLDNLPVKKSAFVASNQRRQAMNAQLNKNMRRHHNRQKTQKNYSNVHKPTLSSSRRNGSEDTVSYTGPKVAAWIKAQKYRAKEDSSGYPGQSNSVNFEGPKPLSEILKGKKGNNDGSSSA